MSPLIATAAAVTSDARPSRIAPLPPDVDAEVRGRLLAEQEAVEGPRPQQDQDARDDDDREGPDQVLPRGVGEPAQQVAEDLPQPGAGQVHRHRQTGGQQRADRVAGQEQAGQRREAAESREPVHDDHGRQGADEGEAVEEPEPEHHGCGPG